MATAALTKRLGDIGSLLLRFLGEAQDANASFFGTCFFKKNERASFDGFQKKLNHEFSVFASFVTTTKEARYSKTCTQVLVSL